MPGIKDSRTVRLSLFADAGSVWDDKTYNDSSNSYYTKARSKTCMA